ncbi:hypothetical protein Bca52824_085315 [Brassica carinata]|uniref:Pectinesterase inhibitor domain-containing protein n=1 Tax=Brassica carinata TaxID=52824 RepID=A0A8X7TKX2_BRACI|nr:hypothetical protein Bca52824_085315 [Brassica carinata]
MGISCITRNTYSILSLHFLLILIITPSSSSFTPTDIVTKETLNKLCSHSILYNRRFCVKWLSADNRTTAINIHGLMELAAEKAQVFGQENLELMNLFARISGNDKQLKNASVECVNGYGIAIKELEVTKDAASKAVDYAYVCKDQFEGPSNEPPFVLNRSVKFIEMCHIRSRNLSKHCFAASSSNPKLVARLSNRSCPFIFERRILNFGNGSCEFSSTTAIRRGLRAIDLVSYVFPLFFKRCRLFSIGWALRPSSLFLKPSV